MSIMSELDTSIEEVLELVDEELELGAIATNGELIERANFHARARNPTNSWPVLLPELTKRVFERFEIPLH